MSERSRQSPTSRRRWTLAALLLAAGAWPLVAGATSISIAAVVNDSIITSADLAERRDLAMAFNNVEPTAENQQRITPFVLRGLIEETLQMEEAKRLSITISDEEVAKAIASAEKKRGLAEGGMEKFMRARGLSRRSLEAQLKATIAWSKVVQRKLRRNVSISEDEIARAQLTEAAAPGVEELRIAIATVPVQEKETEEKAAILAKTLVGDLQSGANMETLALKYGKEGIKITPPRWVEESQLPPGLQQAFRALADGEATPPIRTPNGYDILQLVDRRTTKPLPDMTEVVIKEIQVPVLGTPNKEVLEKWRQEALIVRANPGSCTEPALAVENTTAKAQFVRAKLGDLPGELRNVVTNLGVSDISEPIPQSRAISLVMLCERIEPANTTLADADVVRQKLFAEKLELEAAKRMRDLKRDAYIDIKGTDAS